MPCCKKLKQNATKNVRNLIPCDAKPHKIDNGISKDRTKFRYIDLYVIGKIWIDALSKALVGEKITMIPRVNAAKLECRSKPPKMKYKDLPLYHQKSPHAEYKELDSIQHKCPDADKKLLHSYLLPHVRHYRSQLQDNIFLWKCEWTKQYNCYMNCAENCKDNFLDKMRDPANINLRYAIVSVGGITGWLIGGGGGVPRRLFFTSIGLLSTGALCFPYETDEKFRNVLYGTSKACIAVFNKATGNDFHFRERVPCDEDKKLKCRRK